MRLSDSHSIVKLLILTSFLHVFTFEASSQHKHMIITFNENGKLLDGHLPRYKPYLCNKDCKVDNSLTIRVMLPLGFYNEEKKNITEMAEAIHKAVNDSTSTLYRILNCNKNPELKSLQEKLLNKKYLQKDTVGIEKDSGKKQSAQNNQSNILNGLKWNFDSIPEVFPKELQDYLKFIEGLEKRDISVLNSLKDLSPFKLKVKGMLLDKKCYRFVHVNDKNDPCECIKESQQYVALEFDVPPGLITRDLAVDSFQLLKQFPMKTVAINWYKEMLKEHKEDLLKLKLIQETVRKQFDTIAGLLTAIDTLKAIEDTCKNPKELVIRKIELGERICKYKTALDSRFGQFNCTDACTDNILICSSVLAKWVLKLAWLNGEYIKLNPFNFTTTRSLSVKLNQNKEDIEKKEALRRNALIQLNFWDTAIIHLRDSVMLAKQINIDSNYALLQKLIKLRDSLLTIINKNSTQTQKDESAENEINLRKFATISQTSYKGWLIPYKSKGKNQAYKADKMWIRNYYFDELPNPLRYKQHFTYPEDENITLLLHNLPSGTAMEVTESLKPFADSAAFTILAGEAVTQIGGLYSSIGTIAPIVQKLLKSLNAGSRPQELDVVIIDANHQIDTIHTTLRNFYQDAQFGLFKALNTNVPLISFQVFDSKRNEIAGLPQTKNPSIEEINQSLLAVLNNFTGFIKELEQRYCNTIYNNCYLNYLKSLLVLATAPSLIEEDISPRTDTTPVYYTGRYQLSDQESPYKMEYRLRTVTKKAGEPDRVVFVDSSYIKVGKFRKFQLAAGLAYSPDAGFITSVDTTGGGFKVDRDEDKFRLIAGIRWYPAGLYNQKDPVSIFRDFRWVHRLSVLVATSVPKPLENIYLGAGFDVVPGLNLSLGVHMQQKNRYIIVNNQVERRTINYHGHLFYSVTVDPGLLVNAITSLF